MITEQVMDITYPISYSLWGVLNPNTIKSYKILQKLSPKHAAHGVAQSTYPNYRHGKACLSKQAPWRAAGDPCLARGMSRVRAPGPAGALRALFSSPSLPPSGHIIFRTFPTSPAKVFGLKDPTGRCHQRVAKSSSWYSNDPPILCKVCYINGSIFIFFSKICDSNLENLKNQVILVKIWPKIWQICI